MDLGLAFDDDDLITAREKNRDDICSSYCVKTCTPEWFESMVESYQNDFIDTVVDIDQEQMPQIFKFSGDFHYHKQNYEVAAQRYKRTLDMLPDNNVLMKLDVRESLCRCYMHCGLTNESLQMAKDMVSEMSNQDEAHQRQALILLYTVYKKMGKWAECVDCLEQLCTKHPYFAQSWDELGDAYMKPYSHPTVKDCIHLKEDIPVTKGDNCNLELCLVRPLTCYIRASLLYQAVMNNASSLTRARNTTLIAKILKKIEELPMPETQKTFASQIMRCSYLLLTHILVYSSVQSPLEILVLRTIHPSLSKVDSTNSEIIMELCIREQFNNHEHHMEGEESSDALWNEASTDVTNVSYPELFYNKFCLWFQKLKT